MALIFLQTAPRHKPETTGEVHSPIFPQPYTHGSHAPAAQLDVLTAACYTAAIHSDGKTLCVAEPCHCSPSQTVGVVWPRHIPEGVYPEERKHGENQAYSPDHPRP